MHPPFASVEAKNFDQLRRKELVQQTSNCRPQWLSTKLSIYATGLGNTQSRLAKTTSWQPRRMGFVFLIKNHEVLGFCCGSCSWNGEWCSLCLSKMCLVPSMQVGDFFRGNVNSLPLCTILWSSDGCFGISNLVTPCRVKVERARLTTLCNLLRASACLILHITLVCCLSAVLVAEALSASCFLFFFLPCKTIIDNFLILLPCTPKFLNTSLLVGWEQLVCERSFV
jgi:hypothetical protein